MSLSDLAAIGSFISGLAVLISLIFLYFQLRQVSAQVIQAEKNQQATIRAARTTRVMDLMLTCTDPPVANAVLKGMRGANDLTDTEVFQFVNHSGARFFNAEDSFYQHREGLLNEFSFDGLRNGLRVSLTSAPMRVIYKHQRIMMGREFVEFMDQLLATIPVAPVVDQSAQFRAEVAAELAHASG
jgi:hypothetical protein